MGEAAAVAGRGGELNIRVSGLWESQGGGGHLLVPKVRVPLLVQHGRCGISLRGQVGHDGDAGSARRNR